MPSHPEKGRGRYSSLIFSAEDRRLLPSEILTATQRTEGPQRCYNQPSDQRNRPVVAAAAASPLAIEEHHSQGNNIPFPTLDAAEKAPTVGLGQKPIRAQF